MLRTKLKCQITAYCCHVPLNPQQEKKVVKMYQPYSEGHKLWYEFAAKLEAAGALEPDHGLYGGIDFRTKKLLDGEKIAELIYELLQPKKRVAKNCVTKPAASAKSRPRGGAVGSSLGS